jgi:hypothetical protein
MPTNAYEVRGTNAAAPFTLRIHRGDGMALLAMNWRGGEPPDDFVGFAIEYREPGGTEYFALKNRLTFDGDRAGDNAPEAPKLRSTLVAPIQKFRWVHFPRNADLAGLFRYRVKPVFMAADDSLSYGKAQSASIELRRETYPGRLNVSFTRGFVSSQAFVDRYEPFGSISTLLPDKAANGLTFTPTHPRAKAALAWMGFEARSAILDVLDEAVAHPSAQVRVVAYDLSEPGVVERLEQLGPRLEIIIDDAGDHGEGGSGETQAADRLAVTAGAANVKRQHMGQLQHNKTIVVDGTGLHKVVCGSTNFSWRGFFVQSNNAVVLTGTSAVAPFLAAFDQYWASSSKAEFGASPAAGWIDLGLHDIDAAVAFSPHSAANSVLASIAADIDATTSSLFYSLAFLYQTKGAIREAVTDATASADLFVFGMSDKPVGGFDILSPDGNRAPVSPDELDDGTVPEPFRSEPVGGGGARLHHKFVVIDFDTPDARVYLGSYNFSGTADAKNGENLLLVRDRKVAVSYMVEAVRIFDHYRFRLAQRDAATRRETLALARPPRAPGETPWWKKDYLEPSRIRDRTIFA